MHGRAQLTKTVRYGRFLIHSKLPITQEELRILNHKDYCAISLVWGKVMRGTWRIMEIE